MFESIQGFVPQEWRGAYEFFVAPLAWIPDFHAAMINFAWYGGTTGEILLKRTLLLMPMLLLVVTLWSTMVALYTVPFRSGRGTFMTTLLMSWWDVARSIWFYWAGLVRLAVLLVGWLWGLLRLGVQLIGRGIKGAFQSPMMFLDWTSRSYFKPGVPWIAFLALLLWCAVEATIFMYTLSPTMTEVLAGITGYEPNPLFMGPILWVFLAFLILGSFACIQVFSEAVRNRRFGEIVQMAFVEAFVMFFEVIFLYRELVDAVTPWIAQTTNEQVQLGLFSTLMIASFGWIGVRGMTWFLFGRFGTPAVLAILSRETVTQETSAPVPHVMTPDVWRGPIDALKAETKWFKQEAQNLFELLSLPVLQVVAAAVNSIVVVIMGQPMFRLPFKNLGQLLALTPRWPTRKSQNGVALEPSLQEGGAP
jgi:hypothetical protein